MFYVNGWMPLKDVYDQMYAIYRDYLPPVDGQAANGTIFEWVAARDTQLEQDIAEAHASLWRALQEWAAARKLAVLTPSGDVVSPVADLVACRDEDNAEGIHLDLSVGTIGSVDWCPDGYEPSQQDALDDSYPKETSEAKQRRYGPFTFCPLLIDRQEAEDALRRKKAGRPFERRRSTEDEIVQEVSERARRYLNGQGERPTKDWVRKSFGFKSDKDFNPVWEKIIRKEPTLAHRGRPKTIAENK